MLKNYLKVALRTLRRHAGYTFINIAGLAVGVACCLLILLHVRDELSYDRFHEHADGIFRVIETDSVNVAGRPFATTPALLAPAMQDHLPVEAVRFYDPNQVVLSNGERRFNEAGLRFTDANVFDVFSFRLREGDPRTALAEPNTIVLTDALARRYFGEANPLGQTLTYEGDQDLRVTGILEAVPHRSHLQFDALVSFSTLGDTESSPWSHQGYTYVLLPEGMGTGDLERQLQPFYEAHLQGRWEIAGLRLHLEPLTEIHLYSEAYEGQRGGDVRYLYIFMTAALLILLVACINYMNLATARSTQRGREVGVRKVVGAGRGQLAGQFLGEALLTSLLATVLALVLAELALPFYNALTGKTLGLPYGQLWFLPGLFGLMLLVGLMAGSYPAFFLTAFRPVEVLKGGRQRRAGHASVRKSLIVVQFAISALLLIATGVVQQQLEFVRTKQLGFDKEQVLEIPLHEATSDYEAFKQEVLKHPGVLAASAASGSPLNGAWQGGREVDGEEINVHTILADRDVVETLGLNLVQGRDFSEAYPADAREAVLVNETAARMLVDGDPIGHEYHSFGMKRIVGVVEDFHTLSLHEPIAPTVIEILPGFFRTLLVRVLPEQRAATLAALATTWQQFVPHRPFEYEFIDQDFAALYRTEQLVGQLFRVFAGLAVFIACLGLFGLAAFTAEQRTKEIGIRKVLGASTSGLVALLSRDFVKLVGLAFVIAAPLAYLAMERWLENFAYRIEISWRIFLVTGLLALGVALVTVSYQAVRAALADPVKSLRYE